MPTTYCYSFDSSHSWLKLSHSHAATIPHRSYRFGESAYSNAFTLSFPSVKIRVLRFIRVLLLPNSTTQIGAHLLCLRHTVWRANGATLYYFSLRRSASARDHFFNQKPSASDFFNIVIRLTAAQFWSTPAWRSFLSQSALSALSLPQWKESGARAPHSKAPGERGCGPNVSFV